MKQLLDVRIAVIVYVPPPPFLQVAPTQDDAAAVVNMDVADKALFQLCSKFGDVLANCEGHDPVRLRQ